VRLPPPPVHPSNCNPGEEPSRCAYPGDNLLESTITSADRDQRRSRRHIYSPPPAPYIKKFAADTAYFVTVTELSLVAGRAPPENELAYCVLLVAITLTTLFYTRKLDKTVSYRKQIARLHSCRRWRGRPCSNSCLIGGRLITVQNLGTVSHHVRACQIYEIFGTLDWGVSDL